ncbi:Splicing factor 3b subunit 2 [Spraguea lophii 42_110]|uniref:Splicing factor 3b subunit 2 n=1 Tax=Spraguea lophii (strain 42_110) TaxID=1358809 RepID=S7XJS6_SPRLO|nr:Splicing factor 3b subunit 2 [Spraguea lophii 42_110]
MTKKIEKDSFYSTANKNRESEILEHIEDLDKFKEYLQIEKNIEGKNKKERKQQKKLQQFFELKKVVPHPELLKHEDVSCKYPIIYNTLKGMGTVSVPDHWESSKKYLKGRKYQKPSFVLPENIKKLQLYKLREEIREKDIKKKVKEKLYPKMEQKIKNEDLINVFKEKLVVNYTFDIRQKIKKGEISQQLKEALGLLPNELPPWITTEENPPTKIEYIEVETSDSGEMEEAVEKSKEPERKRKRRKINF